MISCKRCGIPITFDNGRCINANSEIPHFIQKCSTKRGYVYCPRHQDTFPQNNPCSHYQEYGYRPGDSELFIIQLIQENYQKGSFFNRKNRRKTSFDKLKEGQKCNLCGYVFPRNAKRQDMDLHEEHCKLQTKLI